MGPYIQEEFQKLKQRHSLIGDIRGKGFMIGVDLVRNRETKERAKEETAKICWGCWEKGLFLTFFSDSVLRIVPPLVISQSEVKKALDIIDSSMKDLERGKIPDDVLNHVKGW